MFQYINYVSDKKELISKLNQTKARFMELHDIVVDSPEVDEAIRKIESVIENTQSDVLSLVLVGAFSDGKTSVIAGLLNEEMDDMKIDSDESSDEILRYVPASLPDGCQIVDTPGLFGDKEGHDQNGSRLLLSDLTKQYISEANVILYVVPSKNPIKDSHKECIKWILSDLNKLSSTVFVINKMDDISDLTDEEDFEIKKKTITDSLRKKLLECGVGTQDANNVRVVCISAAPDGKKIGEWEKDRDEYLKRSRMTQLEEAIAAVLSNSREELIVKTGCDVLNNELNNVLSFVSQEEHNIEDSVLPEKRETLRRNQVELDNLKKRIKRSRDEIIDELKKLRQSKIAAINSTSMESFRDTMEEEIGIEEGNEGSVLSEAINDIYNRYAEEYSGWTIETGNRFIAEYEKQDKAIANLLKRGAEKGIKAAKKIGADDYKKAIFAVRDLLKKVGVRIKFKPYQVVKMAKFAVDAVPYIGAAFNIISEAVEGFGAIKQNQLFKKNKKEIEQSIKELFEENRTQLNNDDWFFSNFAPGVITLEKQILSDEREIALEEEKVKMYSDWAKRTNEIELRIS